MKGSGLLRTKNTLAGTCCMLAKCSRPVIVCGIDFHNASLTICHLERAMLIPPTPCSFVHRIGYGMNTCNAVPRPNEGQPLYCLSCRGLWTRVGQFSTRAASCCLCPGLRGLWQWEGPMLGQSLQVLDKTRAWRVILRGW